MQQRLSVPGGQEWVISGAGYEARINAVGATVRQLTHDGIDLIVPFSADEIRPLYRGALIAPWPNRIADGRYQFDGNAHQLPINEIDRGNALHGLVLWDEWALIEHSPTTLILQHRVTARTGYPFTLDLDIEFQVGVGGLRTTLRARNASDVRAPYGCCPHPYLRLPMGRVDDWTLTLPARTRLETDDRLLPVGRVPVDSVDCDFRGGQMIGAREIDHAFTDLDFTGDLATASLTNAADGTGVQISWSPWAPWVQVHTADRPEPGNNRIGLALEPMNCPPDAFNSGPPVLEPGQTHTADWLIGATRTDSPE